MCQSMPRPLTALHIPILPCSRDVTDDGGSISPAADMLKGVIEVHGYSLPPSGCVGCTRRQSLITHRYNPPVCFFL